MVAFKGFVVSVFLLETTANFQHDAGIWLTLPGPADVKCCRSSWDDGCEDYPADARGSRCSNAWEQHCWRDEDCAGVDPTPTPTPTPTPPGPAPTPPQPSGVRHMIHDKCVTAFTIPATHNKSVQSGVNLCDCDLGCQNPDHHKEANTWTFEDDFMYSPRMEDANGELCVLQVTSEDVGEMLFAFEKDLAGQFFGGCVKNRVGDDGYWYVTDNNDPTEKCVHLDESDRNILKANKSECTSGWSRPQQKQDYELV